MQIIDARLAKVVSWSVKERGCSIGVDGLVKHQVKMYRIASLSEFLDISSQNLREHGIEFH